MLIISGSPQDFPVGSDQCGGQIVMPDDSCEVTIGFEPTKAGERSASVFLISNTPQPVNVVSMTGEGMLAPNGTVELTDPAKVGVPIVCLTAGFREVDAVGYQWLRDGAEIDGREQLDLRSRRRGRRRLAQLHGERDQRGRQQTVTSAPSEPSPPPTRGQRAPGRPVPSGARGATGATGEPGETSARESVAVHQLRRLDEAAATR